MQLTEDERVLAALSHASIVANAVNLTGIIATSLIWTMQRERSRYVRAHALQSLMYQGVVLLISVMLAVLWGLCMFVSLLPALLRPDLYRDSGPPDLFWLALIGIVVPIGFLVLASSYGLYGAYQAYHGRFFHYPLAGRLAQREFEALVSQPAAAAGNPSPASSAPAETPAGSPPAGTSGPPDGAPPGGEAQS